MNTHAASDAPHAAVSDPRVTNVAQRRMPDTKDTGELAPIEQAYFIVLKDLRSRAKMGLADEARVAMERALSALEAAQQHMSPAAGSAAERAEEVMLERLDP
jgi:hypothetical protein